MGIGDAGRDMKMELCEATVSLLEVAIGLSYFVLLAIRTLRILLMIASWP